MSALLNLELERGDVQVVVLPLRRQAKHSQFALRRQRTFQFVERANVEDGVITDHRVRLRSEVLLQ